ncbi:MAG: right-handed parallel beta-helix repeat-containing protein [Oscillospiraceae bacterium]|jgi:hypothetical protein|nr:right-handed parallel beta-helix repeat-containing protein [Oscillospiraceae bacterium]
MKKTNRRRIFAVLAYAAILCLFPGLLAPMASAMPAQPQAAPAGRGAGSGLDPGAFTGTPVTLPGEALAAGLLDGALAPGIYRTEDTLRFGARAGGKVVDGTGIKVIAPGIRIDGAENLTIRSLVLESASGIVDETGGAWIENNVLLNAACAVTLSDGSTAMHNTIRDCGTGVASSGKTNVLAALNDIGGCDDPILFEGMVNAVALMNTLPKITAKGTNITVAGNSNAAAPLAVGVTGSDYVLVTDNENVTVSRQGCTNLYGNDIPAEGLYKAAGNKGADESLLPRINTELFVPMPRREEVRAGGERAGLHDYLNRAAREGGVAIVPPGAYSCEPVTLDHVEGLTVYAYGALAEFKDFTKTSISLLGSEGITFKGLAIDFREIPNGQATVVKKSFGKLTVACDPGFLQDLLDEAKFTVADKQGNTGTLELSHGFRKADNGLPYADLFNLPVTATESPGVFTIDAKGSDAAKKLRPGDKIVPRGKFAHVIWSDGSGTVALEDVTIFSGSGFGFCEYKGGSATRVNRLAVLPGPAPVLPDGTRGPARLVSTCDATHSVAMREGPRLENSLFMQMTDDALNVNSRPGTVAGYDAATKTLTCKPFEVRIYKETLPEVRAGDRILIYTKEGRPLCDTFAAADGVRLDAETVTVTIQDPLGDYPELQSDIDAGNLVIQNQSASGSFASVKNCLVDNQRSSALRIRSSESEISNCTFLGSGMGAIRVTSELAWWPECAYVENMLIKDNYIDNNGYLGSEPPIVISGLGGLRQKNIRIEGNLFGARRDPFVLSAYGVQGLTIIGNDLGYQKGCPVIHKRLSRGIHLEDVNGAEISGNKFPAKSAQRVRMDGRCDNIFGEDMGQEANAVTRWFRSVLLDIATWVCVIIIA